MGNLMPPLPRLPLPPKGMPPETKSESWIKTMMCVLMFGALWAGFTIGAVAFLIANGRMIGNWIEHNFLSIVNWMRIGG
jgi:hypothetical protein